MLKLGYEVYVYVWYVGFFQSRAALTYALKISENLWVL